LASSDLTPQQRAALVLWLLMQQPMTTRQLAGKLGLTDRGTRDLLSTLSCVVPIYQHKRLWSILK